jgi:hypothetical protein
MRCRVCRLLDLGPDHASRVAELFDLRELGAKVGKKLNDPQGDRAGFNEAGPEMKM